MKRLNTLGVAVALVVTSISVQAAVEDAGHISLGPVEMTPQAAFGIGYDDNVYRQGEGELANIGSAVYKLAAEAEFKAQSGLNTYTATVAARNTSYGSQAEANYLDFGLVGAVHQEFNSRNRLDVDLDVGRYHDAGNTINGAIDKAPPAYDLLKVGAKYGFGSMEARMRADLFASINRENYTTGGGTDNRITEFGATGYYRFLPKTSGLLEIKQRNLDYTVFGDGEYDITSYLVGLSWDATSKTNGYAKVGMRTRDAVGTGRQNFTGWEVGINYLPVDYSLIQLSTVRDFGLESEEPANADFTEGTTTQLSWQHQWTGKISTNIHYAFTDALVQNNRAITQIDRQVNQYGIAVNWNVLRNTTVSLSWEGIKRDERAVAVGADPNSYDRSYYLLSASVAL